MARLDSGFWDDDRSPTVQFLAQSPAKEVPGYLYFGFHDWMRTAPALSDRIASTLSVHKGLTDIRALGGPAARLELTGTEKYPGQFDAYRAVAYRANGTGDADAIVAALPWAVDDRLAYLVHHSWFDRSPDAALRPDPLLQVSMHALLVQQLVSDGYIGMLTYVRSPVIRTLMVRQLDWYSLVTDLLPASVQLDSSADGTSRRGLFKLLVPNLAPAE